MTSEIRTNTITSRAGLSTVTLTDTGPMFSGITTFVDNSTFSVGTGATIHAPATNTLNIGVNNTESLRIDSNSNLKVAGIVTATHFYGNGSNLTGITGTTINNNANNRLITGSGTANTLEGEANFTFDGTSFTVGASGNSWNTITRGDQTHFSGFHFNDSGSSRAYLGVSGATNHIITGSAQHDVALRSESNLLFAAGGATERLRIDSVGNINVNSVSVSSPYSSNFRHININKNLFLNAQNSSGGFAGMQNNAYLNSSGNWVRVNNDHATSIGTDDGNFYFRNAGAGTGNISWNHRLFIPSDGRVLIGRNSTTNITSNSALTIQNPTGSSATRFNLINSGSSHPESTQIFSQNNDLAFLAGSNERLRIASNGQATFTGNKVKINGGTTARSIDVETTHGSGGEIASFQNNNSGNYGGLIISGGEIDRECRMEAAWGSGFFTYWTNNAERMRIDASGHTFFSQMTGLSASGSNKGINIENTSNYGRMNIHANSSAGNALGLSFYNNGNNVGTVYYNTSGTSYNTSSDYRLKENEVLISDGIKRLKTLKPYRFNFKSDPTKTVDGFFAHEVTAVPEAIQGEKDAEEMQQIDQSKLVPLLTAALQEAITKIEKLEQDNIALRVRVTNLEGN